MAKKAFVAEEPKGFLVRETVSLSVSQINPAPYNPRTISPEMLLALKNNIRKHGFLDPLVVQKKGMVLIGGHQRLRAVKEIAIEEGMDIPKLPCVVLDLSDREAKKLNIALNKIGGDFDARLLGDLLETIHEEQPFAPEEVHDLGYGDEEFSKFLRLSEPPVVEPEEPEVFGRSVTLSLEFDDVKKRDALKAMLVERAKTEQKKSGDIVFAAFEKPKKSK